MGEWYHVAVGQFSFMAAKWDLFIQFKKLVHMKDIVQLLVCYLHFYQSYITSMKKSAILETSLFEPYHPSSFPYIFMPPKYSSIK